MVARIERGELDRARLMLKALLVFPFDPAAEHGAVEVRAAHRRARAARGREGPRRAARRTCSACTTLRISYKELRYSIELLAEALPLDSRAMLEPAVVFQKRLGEIHDVDVAHGCAPKSREPSLRRLREEALAALAKVREKRIGKYLRELDPLGRPAAKRRDETRRRARARARPSHGHDTGRTGLPTARRSDAADEPSTATVLVSR